MIPGWLVFDFSTSFGLVDLLSHSVVERPDGIVMDITPPPAAAPGDLYPFLRHEGKLSVYNELIRNSNVTRLRLLADGRIGYVKEFNG